MKGIIVEYSLNPDYFKVGHAYEIRIGNNDVVCLLSDYSAKSVTFKFLNKGEIDDLTLSVDQLKSYNGCRLIKMKPDYDDGRFQTWGDIMEGLVIW